MDDPAAPATIDEVRDALVRSRTVTWVLLTGAVDYLVVVAALLLLDVEPAIVAAVAAAGLLGGAVIVSVLRGAARRRLGRFVDPITGDVPPELAEARALGRPPGWVLQAMATSVIALVVLVAVA